MKTRLWKMLTLILCAALLSSVPLSFSKSASQNNNKHLKPHKKTDGSDVHVGVDIYIGNDRDSIRQYFFDHAGSLPPGLAKRGSDLPPGLQKQLRRKGQLPPGLAKKVVAFPVELERRLPPLKPGLVRGVIEGRAVIFNAKTSVILDIFSIF